MNKYVVPIMLVALTAVGGLASCGGKKTPVEPYFQINQKDYKVTFNELRTSYQHACEANQKGEVRALVCPVEFEGEYSADNLPAGREGTIEDIKKAIFGGDHESDPEMNWESLHSFYQKSSYGQCNITGDVLPWYSTGKTPQEFQETDSVNNLVHKIFDNYAEGLMDTEIDFTDYDANKDGYVDLFLMVYSCPTGSKSNLGDQSMYWAYTTDDYDRKGLGTVEKPIFSRYWWTSVDFMYRGGYYDEEGLHHKWDREQIAAGVDNVIDAHTFIHETGHGLGLADYYSYDDQEHPRESPLGNLDMMDNNIGDHNAYSKALYGWISPYVVQDSCEITIKPFQQNGDSIIVPIREKNWKENSYTLMDEYLVLQYDTPEGLNYADGQQRFEGYNPLYYNQPGVRIMHTDSRMAATHREQNNITKEWETVFDSYVTTPFTAIENGSVDFAHDNTRTRTVNGNRLLELVEPKADALYGYTDHLFGPGTNDSLWKPGQVMRDYMMNTDRPNGGKYNMGFSIEVTALNENGATIKFTKVN